MCLPWLTCSLAASAVAIWLLPGAGAALGWEPGAAPWRLLSSQLAHWDGNHLLWDALAVLLLGCWAERAWPRTARTAMAAGLVFIPAAMVLVYPELAFRGLSGLACTLAAVAGFGTWRERERDPLAAAVAVALLGGLLVKIVYEFLSGEAVFVNAEGWIPLPLAHLAGFAIAGFVQLVQAKSRIQGACPA